MPRDSSDDITASTPGAVLDPGNSRRDPYWRMPTEAEKAKASYDAAYAALSPALKAKVESGQLRLDIIESNVGGSHNSEMAPSGIRGFTAPAGGDMLNVYDINGNLTKQVNAHGDDGGFFDRVFSGVGDFFADPAKATTQFFKNPGVTEATLAAAALYGMPALQELAAGTGAAAGTAASVAPEVLAADLAAYPTAGIVGDVSAAASGIPSLPANDVYVPPEAVSTPPNLPANDVYVPPEAVSTPPNLPANDVYVPPEAVSTPPNLPANDVYVPPEAVSTPPGIPAYDVYVPPEAVSGPSLTASAIVKSLIAGKNAIDSAKSLFGTSPQGLTQQGLNMLNPSGGGSVSSQNLQSTGLTSTAPSGNEGILKQLVQMYPQMANVSPQTMAAISPHMQQIEQTPMPEEQPRYFAEGGLSSHKPEFITGATGHYVKGRGDGQSDDIPAMLADGEYVFDADTVAALGNGSSDAGAKRLDEMREAIRKHKRSAPIHKIPPKAKSPLEYIKG